MQKQGGQRGVGLLSAVVLAGLMTGVVQAWGQEKAEEAAEVAATQDAGTSLRKAGEVSLAEDAALEKVFKEWEQIRAAQMARDGKKAKEIADKLVAGNANRPEAYLVRAELFAQFNAMADAKKDLDKALELEPENARANAMAATLQARSGDSTAALERVEKALKTNPNSAALLGVKADLLAGRQDIAGVIQALKGPAGTLKDRDGAAVLNAKLAHAYAANKQFTEALAAIERTTKLRPGDPQILVIKAQILEASGDVVAAYDTFAQVKNKPGALAANPQFLGQLDAKLKQMEPEVKKVRAQKAAESQARSDAQAVAAISKGRAKAVELLEAYQKAPADTAARDAAAAYILELSLSKPLELDNQLIAIHKSERSLNPVDKAPAEVQAARLKVIAAMTADKNLYSVYYSEKPEESLREVEELIKIYPEVKALEMAAMVKFGEKKYKEAANLAALSAGMAALEQYQRPLAEDEDDWWGEIGGGADSYARHLAAQAVRFDQGKLEPEDKLALAYREAREKKDWAKMYEVYHQTVGGHAWFGSKAPGASRITMGHHKYMPEMEKAMVAKGKGVVASGDKEAIKQLLELLGKGVMNQEESMELKLAAQQALGGEAAVMTALSKTLELYPFNARSRLVLGQMFEQQNKPTDAMYHYNAGARGLAAQGLSGGALENARARDRIEGTLKNEWMKSYTSFIDAERSIANLEKQRRGMVYAAVTRVLPQHGNKPLLHLVRGQEAYHLGMYDECIQDEKKALELNKENAYLANIFIGDANYQLSRKLDLDKAGREKFLRLSAEAYSVSLEKAPDKSTQATLLFSRASRYRDLTEDDKALADFTKASELFDDRVKNKAWSYFEMSKIKEKKGDIPGAKADAQKAVEVAKTSWQGVEKVPATFIEQAAKLQKKG